MRRPKVVRVNEVEVGDLLNLEGYPDKVLSVQKSGDLVLLETQRYFSVGIDSARLVLVLRAS